jgi:hypothetical protein
VNAKKNLYGLQKNVIHYQTIIAKVAVRASKKNDQGFTANI